MGPMTKRLRVSLISVGMPELAGMTDEERTDLIRRWRAEQWVSWRVWLVQSLPFVLVLLIGVLIYANVTGRLGPRLSFSSPVVVFGPAVAIVLGTVLQAWLERRLFRRWLRRMLPHLCSACGYDLTANASGRCPEFGRAVGPTA